MSRYLDLHRAQLTAAATSNLLWQAELFVGETTCCSARPGLPAEVVAYGLERTLEWQGVELVIDGASLAAMRQNKMPVPPAREAVIRQNTTSTPPAREASYLERLQERRSLQTEAQRDAVKEQQEALTKLAREAALKEIEKRERDASPR